MSLFPAFLKLTDRRVVVIGGGSLAVHKIPGLLEAGTRICVASPEINEQLAIWLRQGKIVWRSKYSVPSDLDGAFLVIAATSPRDVHAAVYQESDRRNVLCNAVDDIDHCHFYYGSVVQRGDLQIAVSTNGKSPALAQRLRKEFAQQFGPEYAGWLEWLGAAGEVLRSQSSEPEAPKRWLHALASQPMFEKFMEQANSSNSKQGVA
jgi:siroheme synthase-like protein